MEWSYPSQTRDSTHDWKDISFALKRSRARSRAGRELSDILMCVNNNAWGWAFLWKVEEEEITLRCVPRLSKTRKWFQRWQANQEASIRRWASLIALFQLYTGLVWGFKRRNKIFASSNGSIPTGKNAQYLSDTIITIVMTVMDLL